MESWLQRSTNRPTTSISKSVKNVFPIPRSAVGGTRLDGMLKRLDLRSSSTIDHKLASAKTSLQETTAGGKSVHTNLPPAISSYSRFTRAITPVALAGASKLSSVQNVSSFEMDVNEAYGYSKAAEEADKTDVSYKLSHKFITAEAEVRAV